MLRRVVTRGAPASLRANSLGMREVYRAMGTAVVECINQTRRQRRSSRLAESDAKTNAAGKSLLCARLARQRKAAAQSGMRRTFTRKSSAGGSFAGGVMFRLP